ncbi:MAG: hypothetical protein AAF607_03585 [Pseudomonadota bacterium]
MVVITNIVRQGAGQYGAQDLPLMGAAQMTMQRDGSFSVAVQTMLGPMRYSLTPEGVDNPNAFSAEVQAIGSYTPPAVGAPLQYPAPPTYQAPPQAPPQYQTPPPQAAPPPVYQAPPQTQPAAPPVYSQPAPAPSPQPAPTPPADCRVIDYDPDTGMPICA